MSSSVSLLKALVKKIIKRNPEKAIIILEKILLFQINPQHALLTTHKLAGSLSELSAF
ncbi:MAG: hypothetical protein JWP81_242 [Ferruginibacter sp.]|nr:hypothetical protein [Ferruginibacter sp.]